MVSVTKLLVETIKLETLEAELAIVFMSATETVK